MKVLRYNICGETVKKEVTMIVCLPVKLGNVKETLGLEIILIWATPVYAEAPQKPVLTSRQKETSAP